MTLQLLENNKCAAKAHHWYIINKITTKDMYVWGLCKFCEQARLFKYGMPRKPESMISATFNDDLAPIESEGKTYFEIEIEKRKRAEKTYFTRDKERLEEMCDNL